jgi:putative FmdB family regulatory protein
VPIYEYTCKKCKHEFEILLLSSDQKVSCPKCKAKNPKKRFSVFAHKSDFGFTPSTGGGSACGSCSSSNCSGCGG